MQFCGGNPLVAPLLLLLTMTESVEHGSVLPESSTTQLWLTILGVYMPSVEYPQDTYTSYLEDVEHLISQLKHRRPPLDNG